MKTDLLCTNIKSNGYVTKCFLTFQLYNILLTCNPFACIHMCRGTEEGLEDAECSKIYPLVYISHKNLASAAGKFLYNKYIFISLLFLHVICFYEFLFLTMWYFCVCVRLKSIIASDNRDTKRNENATFIQILISFYIQSEVVSPLLWYWPSYDHLFIKIHDYFWYIKLTKGKIIFWCVFIILTTDNLYTCQIDLQSNCFM